MHVSHVPPRSEQKRGRRCGCSPLPHFLTSLSRGLDPAPSLPPKLRWADKQIKSVTSCLHEADRKSIWAAMLVSTTSNHTSTPWQRVKRVRGRGWPALWTPCLWLLHQFALGFSLFIYMDLHWTQFKNANVKIQALWPIKEEALTRGLLMLPNGARLSRHNAEGF